MNKYSIIHKSIVTSTMDEIKSYGLNTLLFVDEQTKGRGKGNRVWVSDKNKNLYMSLSIDASNKSINYSNISFLSSVCILNTLNYFTNNSLNIQTKWPNDVLVNQKKICGIILEFDVLKKILVIGIGVNLTNHPDNSMFVSTDLKHEGFLVTREDFINYFLTEFDFYFEDLLKNGFKKIHDLWLKNSYNYKKQITVKNDKFNISGIFEGFDDNGTLKLKKDDGSIVEITSGDIF